MIDREAEVVIETFVKEETDKAEAEVEADHGNIETAMTIKTDTIEIQEIDVNLL